MILPTLEWVHESDSGYGIWTGYIASTPFDNMRLHFSDSARQAKPFCSLFIGDRIVWSS